ncbi:plasmid recombination protein [Mameliella sp.]|uniref:plasmid recombination protein n=1 Tax=Mameliella sp. TaxID=1924940 RepID=UPI003B511252
MLDRATTSDFVVLRFAKIRNLAALGAASAHNARTAKSGLSHTNTPPDGGGVLVLDGQTDAVAAWHDRASAVGLSKPRRDSIRAIEAVMSASPSWFDAATPEERDQWTERSLAYARDIFGAENVLQATLHLDEQTPHLHVLAIPLEQKERAKRGRPRKGRKTAKRPTTLSWGLNADGIIGSPNKLRDHQTNYAAALADLGLRRGRPKRATAARHKSAAQYRVEAAEDREQAAQNLAQSTEALDEASETLANATAVSRNTIERAKTKERRAERAQEQADTRAEAFTLGLDAVDHGELVPRPNSEALKRVQVEDPVLPPQETSAFGAWVSAARPYMKALFGYAKRLAGLAERESELKRREAEMNRKAQQDQQRVIQAAKALEKRHEALNTRERTIEAKEEQIRHKEFATERDAAIVQAAKKDLTPKEVGMIAERGKRRRQIFRGG